MPLKRPASCFLLGMLFSASGMGCAAFDALVSGPPSGQYVRPPTERLTAIARVFENQGNLPKAESMYRMAMRQDPSNDFARERVEYIASLGQSRTFRARPVNEAVAAADRIPVRKTAERKSQNAATLAAAAKEQLTNDSRPVVKRQAVEVAAFPPVDVNAEPVNRPTQRVTPASVSRSSQESQVVSPPVVITDINTLTYPVHAAASGDKRRSAVTLDELVQWVDSPTEYSVQLVVALEAGEDSGVQALAAAVLADCSVNDELINQALKVACNSSDSLVRATAHDSLIRRGSLDRAGVRNLLILLTDNDAEIRSQAAATLRNCVGSKWSSECVLGLGELLHDLNPSVRAMAAATLGDFAESGDTVHEARQLLLDIRNSEQNENVLHAIDASLQRSSGHATVSGDGLDVT